MSDLYWANIEREVDRHTVSTDAEPFFLYESLTGALPALYTALPLGLALPIVFEPSTRGAREPIPEHRAA